MSIKLFASRSSHALLENKVWKQNRASGSKGRTTRLWPENVATVNLVECQRFFFGINASPAAVK